MISVCKNASRYHSVCGIKLSFFHKFRGQILPAPAGAPPVIKRMITHRADLDDCINFIRFNDDTTTTTTTTTTSTISTTTFHDNNKPYVDYLYNSSPPLLLIPERSPTVSRATSANVQRRQTETKAAASTASTATTKNVTTTTTNTTAAATTTATATATTTTATEDTKNKMKTTKGATKTTTLTTNLPSSSSSSNFHIEKVSIRPPSSKLSGLSNIFQNVTQPNGT